MKARILVDFGAFWASLAEDIGAARSQILVQTFSFEGDRVGRLLADAMIASRAVDKRILADSFSKVVLSDKCLFTHLVDKQVAAEVRSTNALHAELGRRGVQVKHCNPFGLSPRRLLGRNHKKLIVVDGRVTYIGGINFSEHNASWHDLMLRIEDDAVATFLSQDFQRCWEGKSAAASYASDGAEFHTLDGYVNRRIFQRVLDLIDAAECSIFVASPYISFPFFDRLKDARRREVAVTMLTPRVNNWRYFTDYAKWEAARCGINLRLYHKGMSHLKAMLIDEKFLILGSSNFDFLSYRVYEELLAIVTEPELIASFREQVLLPDLEASEGIGEQQLMPSGWAGLRLKLFNKGLTLLLE